ncbi:hypothetical protein BJY00DRAFT_307948 [Aspergillus carlsbadensis]|nr:hypothetical protein BJY00DRAFT_307948 [Aspergillus carlsbadensis]
MSKPLSFKNNAIDLSSTTPEYFTVNMVPKPRPSSRPHSTCISRAPSPTTLSAAVSALPISDPEPSDHKVYIPLCFCLISFAVMAVTCREVPGVPDQGGQIASTKTLHSFLNHGGYITLQHWNNLPGLKLKPQQTGRITPSPPP